MLRQRLGAARYPDIALRTKGVSLLLHLQGYGTVRFETPEAAQAAIQQYHGSDLDGRTLTVRLDKFA